MVFFSKKDGTIVKIVPESLNQGSENVDTITLVGPFSSSAVVACGFVFPDGNISTPHVTTNKQVDKGYGMTAVSGFSGFKDEDGNDLNAWTLELDEPITELSGELQIQFYIYTFANVYDANGNVTGTKRYTKTTNTVCLDIGRGITPISPTDLDNDDDTYKSILTEIQRIYALVSDFNKAESARAEAEDKRDAAEKERIKAEEERIIAELGENKDGEGGRVGAEKKRAEFYEGFNTRLTTLEDAIGKGADGNIVNIKNAINDAISSIVGSAPETLDTFEEIAKVLGDPENADAASLIAKVNNLKALSSIRVYGDDVHYPNSYEDRDCQTSSSTLKFVGGQGVILTAIPLEKSGNTPAISISTPLLNYFRDALREGEPIILEYEVSAKDALNFAGAFEGRILVDWGDGADMGYGLPNDYPKPSNATYPNTLWHEYQQAGTYTVRVYGATGLKGKAINASQTIKSIKIPNSVKYIASNAIENCRSLETVEISGSVATIGDCVLNGSNALKKLVIHKFSGDGKRTAGKSFCTTYKGELEVIIEDEIPMTIGGAWASSWKSSFVAGTGGTLKMYVPTESLEEYKKATVFSAHAANIEGDLTACASKQYVADNAPKVDMSGYATTEALEALKKLLNAHINPYKPVRISSFGISGTNLSNSTLIYEKGQTVTSVTLKWAIANVDNLEALTLNGTTTNNDGTETITKLSITKDTISHETWTLKATDKNGTNTSTEQASTSSIKFYNGVYYGASSNTRYDSNLIREFKSSKQLRSSHLSSITVNAGEGQYIYYCFPTNGFSEPTFKVGGFEGGFTKVGTTSFQNDTDAKWTESYTIYRSDNAGLGSTTVSIS